MRKQIFLLLLLTVASLLAPASGFAQGTPGTVRCPDTADTLDSLFRIKDRASGILSGALTPSSTAITVSGSTAPFPSSGSIKIDDEVIYYTAKSSSQFTGLTRGASGTIAATHANSAVVSSPILAVQHNTLAQAIVCTEQLAIAAVPNTRTVNGHPLSADVTVSKSDVVLGSVDNVQQLPLSYLDTDINLAANSDVKVASEKAVKSYIVATLAMAFGDFHAGRVTSSGAGAGMVLSGGSATAPDGSARTGVTFPRIQGDTASSVTFQSGGPTRLTTSEAGLDVRLWASDAVAGSSVSGAAKGGDVDIRSGDAKRLTSGNANGGDIRIMAGGPVGTGLTGLIGFNTETPERSVHIVGVDAFGSPEWGVVRIDDDIAQAFSTGGSIAFGGYYNATDRITGANIKAFKENGTSGNSAFGLLFSTRPNGGPISEKLRITSSGNVGIGVSLPVTALQVVGAADGNNGILRVQANNNSSAGIGLYANSASGNSSTRNWQIATSFNAEGLFEILHGTSQNAVPTTSAMAIDKSGNVGIGTTNPGAKLEVNNAVAGTNTFSVSSNGGSGNKLRFNIENNAVEPIDVSFRDVNLAYSTPSAAGITTAYYANAFYTPINIYRLGSSSVVNWQLNSSGTMTSNVGGIATYAWGVGVAGDANSKFLVDAVGKLEWGAGGASPVDTNLYRATANSLQTDDDFYASRFLSTEFVSPSVGSGLGISLDGPGNNIKLSTSGSEKVRVDAAGNVGIGTTAPGSSLTVKGNVGFTTSSSGAGVLADSATAPTISSGFGTSPTVAANNGTIAFTVNVGTGGLASSGVVGMPTATTGWICSAANRTARAANRADQQTVQTATSTTSVTVQNQTISTGAALAWTASDVLVLQCRAY